MRFNFKKTRDDGGNGLSELKQQLDAVLERSALLDDACGVGLWEAVLHDGDSMHPESRWTWSSELRRLLGYESEADFPNAVQSWSDKLHPDDSPAVFAAFSGHLEDETDAARYDVTYRMQVKSGGYRWFRGSGGCRHHADGHTILACGSLTDVHDLVTLQERAAREAEADNHAILALTKALAALAGGDLTHRIHEELSDKTTILKADFNLAADNLQTIIQSVTNAVSALRGGAHGIGRSIEDLSNRTEMQAASLEETAAALDQLTSTVKKTADGARQVASVTVGTRDEAKKSGELVATAVSAMSNIETSSRQISQIIGVIDDIAFQTNLLALNAAVEAARAGDAGKSFGVVAQEVRALAQRSANAAKEIKALISVSTEQVERGVLLVAQTGETIGSIVERFADIAGLVEGIATSTLEQSTGLDEVNTAVTQIDHMTQQNASMVEQTAAASQSLVNAANELAELAGRFQVAVVSPKRKAGQRAA